MSYLSSPHVLDLEQFLEGKMIYVLFLHKYTIFQWRLCDNITICYGKREGQIISLFGFSWKPPKARSSF